MAISPTSINTTALPANIGSVTHYVGTAIRNFKANTPAISVFEQTYLPKKSGTTIQFFAYNVLGANTNQTGEGVVGSPIGESTTSVSARIGQFADYINASDLSLATAIDQPGLMDNLGTELNYRGAFTLNQLALNTLDATASIDSSVNITLAAGQFLTASNVRTAVAQLEGQNVKPFMENGAYTGLIHPFACRDILNDQSYNGLTDILKRGDSGRATLLGPMSDKEFIEFDGVR